MSESENYYRVKEPVALLRILTMKHSQETFKKFFIGICVFYVFTEWIPDILGIIIPRTYFDVLPLEIKSQIPKGMEAQLSAPIISLVYILLMCGVFKLGRSLYLLTYLRNGTVEYPAIFEGFVFYLKATLLYIVESVIVAVGFVLMIVPGIIAQYSMRQAIYILADDPKKGVFKCISESIKMMQGNRMALFRLDVSYLLNIVIMSLPAMLVTGFVDVTELGGMILYLVLSIPIYIAYSYMYLGQVTFYELLISHGFGNFRYSGEKVFREAKLNVPEIPGM